MNGTAQDTQIVAKLGKLGVGVNKASIRISFSRDQVGLKQMADLLIGARLTVRIQRGDPQQENLFEEANVILDSVADCHRISVARDDAGATLGFGRDDVDIDALISVAGKEVGLVLRRIGDTGSAEVDPETGEPVEVE